MNKSELVTSISEKSGLTKKDSEAVLNAFIDSVVETVPAGEKVTLTGFGNFEQVTKKARRVRNPRTGEPVPVPEKKAPKFKAGKEFKEKVKGN